MDRFTEMYDENLDVFDTARSNWKKSRFGEEERGTC